LQGNVTETTDWKQKYRDSLVEMEADERRWRQVEQALRRLVGRLCAAAMGISAQLDDELSALAAANRRNAPAEELESLFGSLTVTIAAVDAVAPVIPTAPAPGARLDATRAAVAAVLKALKEASGDPAQHELLAQLPRVESDAALAALVERVAAMVRDLADSMARERLKSAAILSEVTERLEEVARFVAEAANASRAGFEDTDQMNEGVMSEVHELSQDVRHATDLTTLQSRVSARLENVTQQVQGFRAREEARRAEIADRTARMRSRIEDLEREAQDLYRRLNREKLGARIDSLTRLANRRSFDERLARDIAQRGDAPIALLLFDVDDFKAVNDSFGHRAGDRVLQVVARSLTASLRAEDFIARIGGEEFVALIPASLEEALRVANEMRRSVETLKLHFRGTPVRVSVSCGLTELKTQDSPGDAFDRADAALYRAKREGKNLCISDDGPGDRPG
jgi:diguanylate cyclase